MKGPREAPLPWAILALVVIAAGGVLLVPAWTQALRRAGLATALSHGKAVKFALDGFANDYDGQFPNQSTGEALALESFGFDSSNDYFRQLHMSGETNSERIFWVKRSPVAGKDPPDDEITRGGVLAPEIILQAGDVHWAYLPEQRSSSNVQRLLLADPFPPGQSTWSAESADNKLVAVRIDGSAKLLRLNPDGSLPAEEDRSDEPERLDRLVQPEPAP